MELADLAIPDVAEHIVLSFLRTDPVVLASGVEGKNVAYASTVFATINGRPL